MNDPTLLPALASVVFFRISGYSALKVTEQARLRSQLEGAVAVSLVDVPEDCRILLDASDGMAVAVLHNPEAALDVAERCAGVVEVSIPLAIGINHGAIQVTPDESAHPGLAGDAIGVAASGLPRQPVGAGLEITHRPRASATTARSCARPAKKSSSGAVA